MGDAFNGLIGFFRNLFDTSDFPARWECGNWSFGHGLLHIISDCAIGAAYFGIPITLGILLYRRRRDLPFPRVFVLFALFIFACGTTHFIEALIFFDPIYRVSGLMKALTAIVSWIALIVLIRNAPQAVRLPSLPAINARLEREIRDRRAAEARLQEASQTLRLALSAGEVGTWRYDPTRNEDRRDANLNAILGLAAEPTTTPIDDLVSRIHPDDRTRVQGILDRAARTGGDFRVEYRVVRPDGDLRWVRDSGRCAAAADADGNGERAPAGYGVMSGAVVDITGLKNSSQQLARLAAIVTNSSDAIVAKTTAGEVWAWNEGAMQVYGYSAAEMIGRSIFMLVPADRRRELTRIHARVADGEVIRELETIRVHKDGRRLDISLSLSPIVDAHGNVVGISSIERDISGRKQVERALNRMNDELIGKNEEIEQFVYTVSHDLKSPLVTMLGFIGLLREDLQAGETEDVEDAIGRIEGAATRMSDLIDDLLQLSRIGRVVIEPEPIDVESLAAQVAADFAEQAERAHATINAACPMPRVTADRAQLRQVFENLVGNAIKYGAAQPGAQIDLGGHAHDNEIWLYVRDNGPGIAPEYHERIFGLFQRLDGDKRGTGVGLAAVAKIMRLNRGRVWVESTPGQGATFWLALPPADDAAGPLPGGGTDDGSD